MTLKDMTLLGLIVAVTAVFNSVALWITSKTHKEVIAVKAAVEDVKSQTNGINTALRATIERQENDRIHTAAITEKDKAIAVAEHNPPK